MTKEPDSRSNARQIQTSAAQISPRVPLRSDVHRRHEVRATRAERTPYPAPGLMDLVARLATAGEGIAFAWRRHQGFRYQAAGALAMLAVLALVRPDPMWWALAVFGSLLAVGLELFNSAVEELADLVQPDLDPRIKKVKDLAAAGVVVTSTGVLVVGVLMILHAVGLFG